MKCLHLHFSNVKTSFTESVNIFLNNIISTLDLLLYHFRLYKLFFPSNVWLAKGFFQKMTLVFIFPIQCHSIQTSEELCDWLWVLKRATVPLLLVPCSGFWSSVIREYSHDYCTAASRHSFTPDCRHSTNTAPHSDIQSRYDVIASQPIRSLRYSSTGHNVTALVCQYITATMVVLLMLV